MSENERLNRLCDGCLRSCDGSCKKYRMLQNQVMRENRAQNANGRGRVYTHDGFTGTLSQWAARLELGEAALRSRLNRGLSYDRVFVNEGRHGSKLYAYRGERYTIQELANMAGISYNAMIARLRMYSVEEAVESVRYMTRRKRYELEGRHYTLAELAMIRGVTEDAMRWRMKRMDIHEAVYGSNRRSSDEIRRDEV